MRAESREILVGISCFLGACHLSSGQEIADAGGQEDAHDLESSADAGPRPDAVSADANPDVCQPEKLQFLAGNRPLTTGDYCDDILVCVASADVAEVITAMMPAFSCSDTGCPDGQIACQWSNPDYIEADEYEQLCELTLIDNAPALVRCNLYL